ncbi:MAG: hypothetical protein ACYST0_05625 [Planctomycetota bacterium]|jgi:hypothetical protein
MTDLTDRCASARKLLARTCALVVVMFVAAVAPGCQFLQNEFFYLCRTPKAQQDADEPGQQRHQRP